jgi:hypothetical protein
MLLMMPLIYPTAVTLGVLKQMRDESKHIPGPFGTGVAVWAQLWMLGIEKFNHHVVAPALQPHFDSPPVWH